MRILSDPNAPADKDIERLVLCSGKVFYDLAEARDAAGDKSTTIVRIEQIYPFPSEAAGAAAEADAQLWKTVVWSQEEPKNNGAWFFVEPLIEECLVEAGTKAQRPRYAGRDASAPRLPTGSPSAMQPSRRHWSPMRWGLSVRSEIRRKKNA